MPPFFVQNAGKATVAMLLSLVGVFMLVTLFDVGNGGHVASVSATSTATTTVTVLNTPPAWIVTARELYASATNTPTNAGTSTVWTATANDSNGEDYYLLICKSSSTPTATASGPPVCGGGGVDQWAVSGAVTSNSQAQVSTTTQEGWSESNDWYAYVCDGNLGSPRCNVEQHNGLQEAGPASATSSPFVVNHRPTFTLAADDSPTLPGATVTWTTTASDPDTVRGTDNVTLYVCKAADFDAAIPGCGSAGWATSSPAASNPSTSTDITIPTQDQDYAAYVYVTDEFDFPATGGWQGSSTVLTVANATPYVVGSTVELYDVFGSTTSDYLMALTEPEGQTQNFVLRFDVADDNSCLNSSSGNEITDVDINVYRSTAGDPDGLLCDSTGEYNANSCYTDTSTNFVPTCYQDPAATCTAGSASVTWECTFPLWYIADPTDAGSAYASEDWRASARATDDGQEGVGPATGSYATSTAPAGTTEMTQFLSFNATGSPIAYGSWEPGQGTGVHPATTTVFATGNTGLDEYLSGDEMCVTFPTCNGNATSTIYVPYQHYATSSPSVAYAAGYQLATSTSPVFVNIDVPKTTATTTPTADDTYWGIEVPSSLTYAGDYIGRNYIDAVVSASSEW